MGASHLSCCLKEGINKVNLINLKTWPLKNLQLWYAIAINKNLPHQFENLAPKAYQKSSKTYIYSYPFFSRIRCTQYRYSRLIMTFGNAPRTNSSRHFSNHPHFYPFIHVIRCTTYFLKVLQKLYRLPIGVISLRSLLRLTRRGTFSTGFP